MLCEKCGAYMPDDAITCDVCGTLLKRKPQPEAGIRGIRQGRGQNTQQLLGSSRVEPKIAAARTDASGEAPRVYREDRPKERRRGVERFREDAGRPQSRRGIPRVSQNQVRMLRVQKEKVRPVRKHMVNWMKVLAVTAALMFLGAIGGLLYLTRMPAGQLVLARMGYDAPAQAYWQVGEEYMNKGLVDEAIAAFETADEKDPDNVDGLLSLGGALEAAGRTEEAQTLYVRLYEEVSPERPEAYRNQIRILIDQDRTPEAAELMLLAYENTGLNSFREQRNETLPQMPETDLSAGRYTEEKVVHLTSPQEYDILYLIGDGELPEDGISYEGSITLSEGQHKLKAVCVSGNLYSDPLEVTYNVVLPSPDAPKAGLPPGTYERAQRVWLRYPGTEKDITLYYTIDGSTPDTNSPIYTGDPIPLPGGRVTLRAIAVNSKGKSSNVMEVGYKIQNVAFRMMYFQDDQFGEFKLLSTTMDAFIAQNGDPSSRETVTVSGVEGTCHKLVYGWGYCITALEDGVFKVIEVHEEQNHFTAPRKTKIGMTETEVTSQFRDMGQPNDQNGDRSLYYDGSSTGIILYVSESQQTIKYACSTTESEKWVLEYGLTDGVVTSITHRFVP